MLTIQERAFALATVKSPELRPSEIVLETSNDTITANTAASRARKYLSTTEVTDYIERLQGNVAEQAGLSLLWTLEKYKALYENAIKGDARYDKDGNILDTKPDRVAAKGALDSISRVCGYDAPKKIDISVDLSSWLIQQVPTQIEEIVDV